MTDCTADSLPVVYHLQSSRTRPQLTRITSTWADFAALLVAGHSERDDKDGPGFVLAEMSKPYRAAANVARFDAVLLDMDSHGETHPPSPDIAAEMLASSGLAGVVYTTHSHTDDAPRYRVVVPLAGPVLPADLQRVTRAAADAIGLTGEALDPKSWVVGQFFYLPSCRPDAQRFAACLDGAAFDPPAADDEPLALPAVDPAPAPAARPASVYYPASGASLYDTAKGRARGQWRGILSSLGISVPDRERAHAPCPGCGGKDRFRFDDKDGGGSFICSQGGAGTLAGDGFDLVQHARRVDAAEALRLVCDSLGIQRRGAAHSAPAVQPAGREWHADAETGEILGEAPPPEGDGDQANVSWPDPIDPFGVALPPALPLEILPEALRDYVDDQARLLGCDPAVIGLTSIVAAAACIDDEIELQPKRHDPTWREQARLWVAVVGDPSAKKSPAIRKAMRQVYRIDMRMAEENAAAHAEHEQQHSAWKEAKKSKGGADLGGAEPKKPPRRRLIVENTTVEALSDVLKDNPAGVLTYKDELTGWFASMDAYKGGAKGASMDRADWLEAYNGGRRIIDRVQRGNIIVPNWSTCIIGGIQPDMMRRVSANMGNDGLLQRFMVLVARPASMDEDRAPDMAAMDRFRDLFEQLASIKGGGAIQLSEGAHTIRERVARRADAMVRSFDHPHLVAWLGKWTGLFARLLLTYHVVDCASRRAHPSEHLIGEQLARQVERLMCDVLLHHAVHFYAEVIDQHERQENVRQLGRLIVAKRLTRLAKRDITLGWKASRKLEPWELRAVTDSLCTLGWLEPEPGAIDSSDGKPRAWTVNPKVHAVFAEHGEREAARRREAHAMLRELSGGR